jgi:acyl carrier protein
MKREIAVRLVEEVILESLKLEPDLYSVSSTLANLDADSLDVVEMMMKLEEKLCVHCPHPSIPDTKIQKLKTVGDVIAMLETEY